MGEYPALSLLTQRCVLGLGLLSAQRKVGGICPPNGGVVHKPALAWRGCLATIQKRSHLG